MSSEVDVVVGGGVIGLACAYELASAGRTVHVVDRGEHREGVVGRQRRLGDAQPLLPGPVARVGASRTAVRRSRADAPLYVRPSVSPRVPALALRVPEVLPSGRVRPWCRGLVRARRRPPRTASTTWQADGVETTLTRPGLVHAFLDEGEAERTLALQRGSPTGRTPCRDAPVTGSRDPGARAVAGRRRCAPPTSIEEEGLVDPSALVAGLEARRLTPSACRFTSTHGVRLRAWSEDACGPSWWTASRSTATTW